MLTISLLVRKSKHQGIFQTTDVLLLRRVAETGKPVILSVGFATRDEVDLAVCTLRENGAGPIAILHCVTGYAGEPDLDAMNLRIMHDIRDRYDVVAGFSDNNAGSDVPVIAACMGAAIIEKHFMIARNEGGPDARFSVQPNEFAQMAARIREAERIMGTVRYGCQSDQEKQNIFFRRSLFVVKDMKKGEWFTPDNVRSIRPSVGLPTKHYDAVIGKRATQDIERGTPVSWALVDTTV